MFDTLRRYLKIYFMIVSQDIKSKMQYRTDFFISGLGIILTNISGLVSFWILFHNISNIKGWSYYEIVFMYAFSLLAITPLQLFFDNIWNISRYVVSGDFLKFYFKPIDIFFYYMSEVFDIKGLCQLFVAFFMLCYAWVNLHIDITFLNVILVVTGLFSASLVMIGLMVLASSTAFWLIHSTSILTLIFNFKDYAKYPVTIFNGVFKFLFTFIIPIAFVSYYPSQLLLRPKSIPILSLLSPIVGLTFFFLSYYIWKKGARSYSGTGS